MEKREPKPETVTICLRLPQVLIDIIREKAKAERRSVNSWMNIALEDYMLTCERQESTR